MEEIRQNCQDWEISEVTEKDLDEFKISEESRIYCQNNRGCKGSESFKIKHKSGRTHYISELFWFSYGTDLKLDYEKWSTLRKVLEGKKDKGVLNEFKFIEEEKNYKPQEEIKEADYNNWTKEQLIAKIKELESEIKQLKQNNNSSDTELSQKNNEIQLFKKELEAREQSFSSVKNDNQNKHSWLKKKEAWFTIGGGILAVIGLIIVLVIKKKSRKKKLT